MKDVYSFMMILQGKNIVKNILLTYIFKWL